MPTIIAAELPNTPDASQLIAELDASLELLYPNESRHGYSIEMLLREQVAFFVSRYDGFPAGCGGIKLFGNHYAEIKRMYVRPQFRGLSLAKLMLNHLEAYARENGVCLLRIETGIHQQEAMRLYEQAGFRSIPPFGEYTEDPLSRFYEKVIDASG